MKSRFAPVFIVAATFLAGAVHGASIDKKQTVTLDHPAIVGGTVLPAGTYRIELAAGPDTAKFVKGGRTVAEAPCKVGLEQVLYRGDAVHYRNGDGGPDTLIKIVFASSGLAIEFPTEVAGAAGAPSAGAANRP